MRIERANCWPIAPRWAVLLVAMYGVLLTAWLIVGQNVSGRAPSLCAFRYLTGLPCPTCGTTRMGLAVLHGKPWEAFAHNPLMFTGGALLAATLSLRLIFRRRIVWVATPGDRRMLTGVLIVAVAMNWLYLLIRA